MSATSLERDRPDDRLVDLLIAAEVIYLSDVDERAELSYRLSVRAAAYSDRSDRLAAFKFFRSAYNVRSRLVHGQEPAPRDLKLIDGTQAADLAAFCDAVEGALRHALVKTIRRLVAGGGLPDWDSVVLVGES